jgi:polysaccharide export outer membrane protein
MVKAPGTYVNNSDFLTVFEAIGRAGGLDDFGDRSKLFVIRTVDKETKTYNLNLQDKKILSSTGYFLLPNDIVIVQPRGQKIFTMNLPTISFILTTVSSTLTIGLLLNSFLGK